MAFLTVGDVWVDDLYRIELEDPVEGGEDGIDNLHAKQLGSRTNYLKSIVDAYAIDISDLYAKVAHVSVFAGTVSLDAGTGNLLRLTGDAVELTALSIVIGTVTSEVSFDGTVEIHNLKFPVSGVSQLSLGPIVSGTSTESLQFYVESGGNKFATLFGGLRATNGSGNALELFSGSTYIRLGSVSYTYYAGNGTVAAGGALLLTSGQALRLTSTQIDARVELWNSVGIGRSEQVRAANTPLSNSYTTLDSWSLPDNVLVVFTGYAMARSGSLVRTWRWEVTASRVGGVATVKASSVTDVYVADAVQGSGAAAALVAGDWRVSFVGASLTFDVRNANGLICAVRGDIEVCL